jgi:hypothetical protein
MSFSSAAVAIPQSAFTPRALRARALFLALSAQHQELVIGMMEGLCQSRQAHPLVAQFDAMTLKGQTAISLLTEALSPPAASPATPLRSPVVRAVPSRLGARRGKAAAPVRD